MAATHGPPDCATRPPSTLSPNAGVAPRSNLASVMPLSATGNFRPAPYILFKAMRRPPEKALGGAPAPANGCGFPLAACQPPRASSPAHDPDESATPCLESAFCAQCKTGPDGSEERSVPRNSRGSEAIHCNKIRVCQSPIQDIAS